jgi:hypothetical protein
LIKATERVWCPSFSPSLSINLGKAYMRQLLISAACLGVLVAGAVVGAKDIAGNAAYQVGDALDRAVGQAVYATQNAVNGVCNQATSAASQAGNQVEGM